MAGENVEIALSDLATNWTDVDGDTVEVIAINSTTTNGVTFDIDQHKPPRAAASTPRDGREMRHGLTNRV
jgi:hypothetical protein